MKKKKESIEDFSDRELIEKIFYAIAETDRKVYRIDNFLRNLADKYKIEYEESKDSHGTEDRLRKFIKDDYSLYIRRILSKEE